MAHVIAPVDLNPGGTPADPRCTIYGSEAHAIARHWRTSEILDRAYADTESTDSWIEADDAWFLYENPTYEGSVKFGTCCISTFKLRFVIDVDTEGEEQTPNNPTVTIKLNGTTIWTYTKTFLAGYDDPLANAIVEDVTIDLAAGTVTAQAIRGPNNPGGAETVHTASIGTATPFTAARDRPCGNVWEISAALPIAPAEPVYCRFSVTNVT